MDKSVMYKFLAKTAVPHKKDNDRVYDCIWRAHCDVLVGQKYLPAYMDLQHKKDKNTKSEEGNKIVDYLYEYLKECKEPLTSKLLIDYIRKEYRNDDLFGAIQKLVNMTLKYMIILNEFEGTSFNVDITQCDCPLDSYILGCKKINRPDLKWTRITPDEYEEIQNVIRGKEDATGGNILFDFKNWKERD